MTQQLNRQTTTYSMMPLRDIVLFPYMVAPLVVGRQKSVKALEYAVASKTEIFLATQKDAKIDNPNVDSIHTEGVIAQVLQLLRLPDGTIKALLEGKRRAAIVNYLPHDQFYMVKVTEVTETERSGPNVIAALREIQKAFKEYAANNKKISKEIIKSLAAIDDPVKFIDVLAFHLPCKTDEKQTILSAAPLLSRMEVLLALIIKESEIAALGEDIRSRVKQKINKTQKEYYLNEQIRVIQKEMGKEHDPASELAELAASIDKKNMSSEAHAKALKELKKLKQMPPMSAEATVVRNYIDCILSLPWKEKSESKIDINQAETTLDNDHYGLLKPKERILEYLAVQVRVKKIKGPILCLVGPPGVGKTSLCKSVAQAMGRKFARLSLGGVRDEAEIRGHRRTYIGALPGKIIQSLQKAQVNNPVICLDEVDKMSMDFRGDPSSALLEVLDPEQNNSFNDHYLDLDFDLSDIFFITTANNLPAIPPPLQDRMEVIKLAGYTEEDKLRIAQDFLIPKQLGLHGFARGDIIFANDAIREIVRRYTREAGVRGLERNVASICRKVARDQLKRTANKRYRIFTTSIPRYLGVPRYRFGLAETKNVIGLCTGLAWTEVGGELLQIETALMAGKGKLTVTGKLGDVMQESAQAALSYVRTRAISLGLAPDFYQQLDIHIHVPEGAIPKDGPSAGITMVASLVSALLKIPIRRDIAMTGEITLRGRVLPIGGLIEKLLAARRGNIKHVLIPKENERDLKEIPAKIIKDIIVEHVAHVDEVLEKALVLAEDDVLFKNLPQEVIGVNTALVENNIAH